MTAGPPTAAPVRTGAALALGLVAGVLAGVFGVGGGVILVPALVLLLGLSQHEAHATSLAAILLTAAAAAVPYAVQGDVAWGPAALLALGAIVGAALGARVMHRLPASALRRVFAVVLLVAAARLLLGGEVDAGTPARGVAVAAALAGLGLLAGALSATLGVGGGVVLVPALVVLLGFDQHLAEGTSLVVILPTALVGSLQHTRRGYTRWGLGLRIGAAGTLGGVGGALLAQAVPAGGLQRGFGAFMAIVGLRMLIGGRRSRPPADG